ncbi:MAG: hypothetical protein ACKESB_02385 [Candidatus Hodgkinia cicadicola]
MFITTLFEVVCMTKKRMSGVKAKAYTELIKWRPKEGTKNSEMGRDVRLF